MTNVPNSIATELLASVPAANDDCVGEGSGTPTRGAGHDELSETGGWNAHEVWRRFIKEARERRRSEEPPKF